jgi:hypothetical protein
MTVRITLSEDQPAAPAVPIVQPGPRVERPASSAPVFADWDDSEATALLLFLPDEPEIGRRFSYSGVDWEIVDYRDGWIARLLVD